MKRQSGFGAIAAIVVLVILAVLAAGIVSISTTQQVTSAQDVMSARAWQAARAGNEWGLYQALRVGGTWYPGAVGLGAADPCPAAGALGHGAAVTQPLDLTGTGFQVTVTGDCWRYNEGESPPGTPYPLLIYQIKAVACPATTPISICPPALADSSVAAGVGYIERTRVVIATDR